jgi:hypothetical protein
MTTLDNVNLFAVGGATDDSQDPLYPEYLELVKRFEEIKQGPTIPGGYPDAPTFANFKRDKENQLARQTLATELKARNVKKAYEEGFTQLPIGEQLAYYMYPVTGAPIETYETGYFTDQAGLGIKTPKEMLVDVLNPTKNIFQKSFVKAEDPLSAAIAPLSALGALGGIGELANIPKAGLMALRRMNQKTMDGGGGGGIGGLPAPKQETTKDLAGTYSKTLEEAKKYVEENPDFTGDSLLAYLSSPKRQNPDNNILRVGLPKSEIDEIDFRAFEEKMIEDIETMDRVKPEKGDYTKEELLKYIDDNRIQLYRVSRSEDNPDIRTDDAFVPSEDVEFYRDDPLSSQMFDERQEMYLNEMNTFLNDQKDFFFNNFGPRGIVTKEKYVDYLQKNRSGNPKEFFMKYLSDDSDNPFYEAGEGQLIITRPDGTIQEALSATQDVDQIEAALNQGFTIQPKVLDDTFDADELAERGAARRAEFDDQEGYMDESYRYVMDDGDGFEIIGSGENGYSVRVNGEFDFDNFGENMSFDEAELQVRQYIDREYEQGIGRVDDPGSEDNLIDVLPDDVIEGNATLPTKYGYQYDSFRLPMGGASNYQEHTIHVKNPKTATRYSYGSGTKHFGGGDELFHYRTTVRTDENGKKVLFVEEIQSDLHSTARSTQDSSTYETTPKQKQEISQNMQKIDPRIKFGQLNEDFADSDDYVRFGFDEDAMLIPVSQVRRLAQDEGIDTYTKLKKEGNLVLDETTPGGLQQLDYILKNISPEQLKDVAKQLDSYTFGTLPDFPYKGNAWVDAVTKDAMKLGAELGVDRVAFTNAATQMGRNNKSLNYVQDKVITKSPTREELVDTPEFKERYQRYLKTRYEDQFMDVPTEQRPTQEEYYASLPAAQKKLKDSKTNIKKLEQQMQQKLVDDLNKFKQQYPDSPHIKDDYAYPLPGYKLEAREIERGYRDLADAEIKILAKRMNDDFDITSDPANVDVTNPALARMLDADLNFREVPTEINEKLIETKSLQQEVDRLAEFADIDEKFLQGAAVEALAKDLRIDEVKYQLQDVGYEIRRR